MDDKDKGIIEKTIEAVEEFATLVCLDGHSCFFRRGRDLLALRLSSVGLTISNRDV